MRFETQAKANKYYRVTGTVEARNSKEAADLIHKLHRYNTVRVRPDGSEDKFIVYRYGRKKK